jgi:hypothetical protein
MSLVYIEQEWGEAFPALPDGRLCYTNAALDPPASGTMKFPCRTDGPLCELRMAFQFSYPPPHSITARSGIVPLIVDTNEIVP